MPETTVREIGAEDAAEFQNALLHYAAAGRLLQMARDHAKTAMEAIHRLELGDSDVEAAAASLSDKKGLFYWLDWEVRTHAHDLGAFDEIIMPWEVEDIIKTGGEK